MSERAAIAREWKLGENGYSSAPDCCFDRHDRLWVAWIVFADRVEHVVASVFDDESWSAPIRISPEPGQIQSLSIAPFGDGIAAAWVDGDRENSRLLLRTVVSEGNASRLYTIAANGRPADPVVCSGGGRLALVWTGKGRGRRWINVVQGSGPGELNGIPVHTGNVGDCHRPAAVFSRERIWLAWQQMDSVGSRIRAACHDGSAWGGIVDVAGRDQEVCANPALCSDERDGAYIAWQSDMDKEGQSGLVRWILAAHLDETGNIRHTIAGPKGEDRDSDGEDQGFELPAVEIAGDGRLVVTGRSSQGLWVQELCAGEWSVRRRIDQEGWQCRGGTLSLCSSKDGGVFGSVRTGRDISVFGVRIECKSGVDSTPVMSEPEPLLPDDLPVNRSSGAASGGLIVGGRRVMFGDIHQHTSRSDGTGTPEETYCRAFCRYGDDFAAVADRESFLKKCTPPGEWSSLCRIADDFNRSGEFATLYAYEWTGRMHPGPGHRVVYPLHDNERLFSRDDDATGTSSGLIEECRKRGALVFPHHVGWTGADMKVHDPKVQSCWEIVSCHGAYERSGSGPIGTRGDDKEGQFIGDALDAGLRFGFAGGSDGHGLNWHHGVCRVKDSHRSGLTAVFADHLSRRSIMDALARRRCYATSGARIGLWFEVDGRPMGEEILTSSPVEFHVVVNGTERISELCLVTNGGEQIPLSHEEFRADDRGIIEPPPPDGWSYFYVRVVQDDGQVAWSSPIWLDNELSA